jgi:hypothetical protein
VLVLGTSSSESVFPQLTEKLTRLGVDESVVGMVLPTAYSFNHDGTCLYFAAVTVFLAQATGTALGWEAAVGAAGDFVGDIQRWRRRIRLGHRRTDHDVGGDQDHSGQQHRLDSRCASHPVGGVRVREHRRQLRCHRRGRPSGKKRSTATGCNENYKRVNRQFDEAFKSTYLAAPIGTATGRIASMNGLLVRKSLYLSLATLLLAPAVSAQTAPNTQPAQNGGSNWVDTYAAAQTESQQDVGNGTANPSEHASGSASLLPGSRGCRARSWCRS